MSYRKKRHTPNRLQSRWVGDSCIRTLLLFYFLLQEPGRVLVESDVY